MLAVGYNFDVRRRIIRFVSVDVMRYFTWNQWAANLFGSH
jgi:hypothetical protein